MIGLPGGPLWMIRPDAVPDLRAAWERAVASSPRMGLIPGQSPRPDPLALASGTAGPGYDLVEDTAVIPVHGPIHRHSGYLDDLLAWAFGGVSVDRIADGLRAALADPRAKGIVLSFDSPGGQASGIGELAGMIRQATRVKPVVAYAESDCCSAAYYLASAASKIVAAPSARVGSIGVVIVAVDDSGMLDQMGLEEIVIVSSQSPNKWADPTTPAGKAQYQAMVDGMAGVFIADVAKYRGVSPAHVRERFGKGGVLLGDAAKAAGMVDAVGTLHAGPGRKGLLGGGHNPVPAAKVRLVARAPIDDAAAKAKAKARAKALDDAYESGRAAGRAHGPGR